MFGRRNEPPITSLIGPTTLIKGHVEFEQTLRVEGTVEGNVSASETEQSPTMLVIGEQARITGQIKAGRVIVNGEVHGPIYATELLVIQPRARVFGDLHYHALEMHPGAVVQGRLCHERQAPISEANPEASKVKEFVPPAAASIQAQPRIAAQGGSNAKL